MKEIVALEFESSCAVFKRKRDRRMMIKLRGGTAAFQISSKCTCTNRLKVAKDEAGSIYCKNITNLLEFGYP